MKIHELSFYKDPKIFQLNELAYRSCFIPFNAVIHSRDPQNKRKTARDAYRFLLLRGGDLNRRSKI